MFATTTERTQFSDLASYIISASPLDSEKIRKGIDGLPKHLQKGAKTILASRLVLEYHSHGVDEIGDYSSHLVKWEEGEVCCLEISVSKDERISQKWAVLLTEVFARADYDVSVYTTTVDPYITLVVTR